MAKKILDVKGIKDELDHAGVSHTGGYFHYTIAEKFARAIASRKWFFSHPSRLNDKIEEGVLKDTMYMASFSFGKEENVAMWGNYGWPRADAIRIKIAQNAMAAFVKEYADHRIGVYHVSKAGESISYDPVKSLPRLSIHDVGYLSRLEHSIYHNEDWLCPTDSSQLSRCVQKGTLSSYLKKRGWEYEHEVRLVLDFNKTAVPIGKDGSVCKTVAVDFGDVIDSILADFASITLGPWSFADAREHLKDVPAKCLVPSDYIGMVEFPGGAESASSTASINISNCTVYINGKEGK